MSAALHRPQTFQRFKDLPTEIQLKICKLKIDEEIENLTEGRIIKVKQRKLKQTLRRWLEINENSQSITDPLSRAMELFRNINSDATIPPYEQGSIDQGYNWHMKKPQRDLDENLIGMYSPQSLPPSIAALLSVNCDLRMLVEKRYSFACGIAEPMVFFNFELDTLFLSHRDMHIASNKLSFYNSLIYGLDGGRRKDLGKGQIPSHRSPGYRVFWSGSLKELTVVLKKHSEAGEQDDLIFFEPVRLHGAITVLQWGYVEDLQDFENYDLSPALRLAYYDEIKLLLSRILISARNIEKLTGAPFHVPEVESMFQKVILGPGWRRALEDARQDYLRI
ncbi:hypothetical protein BOTNAR_0138g00040 [Botryotinia narcissicola]|uniref:2EXR domain-containing protein n=1 Tax=Botryotinia narcissicola TaxID=278944 RepID=A0A4Z1IWE5_9HELO|nr:hypothetical protein BOTNAR_0138g00040 [Botryotinia narcissicola]